MAATLTSIIFDEPTKKYIAECMRSDASDDLSAEVIEEFAHLGDESLELRNIGDGDYTLLVGINLAKHNTATLTLMESASHSVVSQSHIDLKAFIQCSIDHYDDYTAATMACNPEEENPLIEVIEHKHMEHLKGILNPYTDSEESQCQMLTVFNFLTGYHVTSIIMNAEREYAEKQGITVVDAYTLPGSKLLN